MASKWKFLKGEIPAFQLEPSYQEKVDQVKKTFRKLGSTELATAFAAHDNLKDEYEQKIKGINVDLEALSQLLVETLEDSDQQSIEFQSGMRVSIEIKPHVSVLDTPEARAQYDKWTHSPKIKKLLTLNARTRDSYVKEELEAGRPWPAWAKVFLQSRAKLTGKKNSTNGDE